MYAFLIVVHVFVCMVLILVILLQAGKGGGFSDLGSGMQTQSILGTQTNTFMTRATEVCAVVFIITSLTLGVVSTHRGKSLVERARLSEALKKSAPAIPITTETSDKVKESVTKDTAEASAKP